MAANNAGGGRQGASTQMNEHVEFSVRELPAVCVETVPAPTEAAVTSLFVALLLLVVSHTLFFWLILHAQSLVIAFISLA